VLDAVIVFSNVLDVSVGGSVGLVITGTNFNISAAVGFISIFGVAIMDGLLDFGILQPDAFSGASPGRGHHSGGRETGAARDDDGSDGHFRSPAGRPLDQDRLADAKAPGDRGRGRHDHDPVRDRYLMPVFYSFYGNRKPPERSSGMAH
jgi:cobalt-zinc-cadmium resistance protein CzcA